MNSIEFSIPIDFLHSLNLEWRRRVCVSVVFFADESCVSHSIEILNSIADKRGTFAPGPHKGVSVGAHIKAWACVMLGHAGDQCAVRRLIEADGCFPSAIASGASSSGALSTWRSRALPFCHIPLATPPRVLKSEF